MKSRIKLGFSLVELLVVAIIMTVMAQASLYAQETKYASGTSSAAVMFPGDIAGNSVVDGIYSTTDKDGGCVKIYGRAGAVPVSPAVAPTNGQTVITIANTDYGLTNADMVVYRHITGLMEYATVSASTPSNITMSAGVSQDGSTLDRIFEVQLKSRLDFNTSGAAVGTNKYGVFEGPRVFCGAAPVRIVQDGTSNAVINATGR